MLVVRLSMVSVVEGRMGDRPSYRPCPWFSFSGVDRGGGGVNAVASLVVERDVDLSGTERGTAWFSPDRAYRYLLTRRWDVLKPPVAWIMLNPSTADAFQADPTITRCIGFAKAWGAGGIEILNLFALRATDPAALKGHPEPVGPDNDYMLADLTGQPAVVVAAWGVHGSLGGRSDRVTRMFAARKTSLYCLGKTKAGAPRHPLYVRADTPLIPWEAAA